MLLQGNTDITHPDDIRFITVNTTISRDTKKISFTQSFELPQESAVITLLNGSPRHARTYTGPDPMRTTYQQFYDVIVKPSGYHTACSIRPPGINRVHAQILNGDAHNKLCRRMWKIDSEALWDKLHALVCPTAVLDPTISARQCK